MKEQYSVEEILNAINDLQNLTKKVQPDIAVILKDLNNTISKELR